MKTISFYKARLVITYPFIFGFYLFFIPALARTALPMQTVQQQTTITGTVMYNNMPMTGVTITVKGKNTTAISGHDGQFSITASPTDTLIFEYLGFKTQILPLNNRTNLTVTLEEDINDLKEVTVNAGYYTVKESERTGSISKISAKDIEKQPVSNVVATMQGRMAGVNVTQQTGVPGGGFSINIRGTNSLRSNGNAPLYVIDGVPYSSEGISSEQTMTAMAGGMSPLNSINPADIESLEILKDADATAIYGSRGANGVVLITTKKGKTGKTVFMVNAAHGVGTVTRKIKMMDTQQYLTMRRGAFANDGITAYPDSAYDVNGQWDQSRYTDWQETLIGGTADIMSLQGSASGGSEQTKFLFSTSYRTETTVFPGDSEYKKGGARLSLDHSSPDQKFRINFSGGYTAQKNELPWTDFVGLSRSLAPNAPALYDDQGNLNWENGTWQNPLVNLYATNASQTFDLTANTLISYQLYKNLELRSSFGYTDLNSADVRTMPSTMYNPAFNIGPSYSTLYKHDLSRQSWIVEPQLNWNTTFGRSKLEVLAGGSFQNQRNDRLAHIAYGFSSNSLIYDLTAASNVSVKRDETIDYRYQAFFGRVNYNYGGKYILNLTGRRDGSSRFGPGRQFATFGAVGAAWLFHKERLFDNSILSFGKIRGSYGTTGSDQIGDYQYLNTYGVSGYDYQGIRGLYPLRLYNADFGWETNKKLEVAAELGFFDDRLMFSAAWFRNRSSNQLVGYPLAGTTGFTSIQSNLAATVENSGLEITLNTQNIRTNDFRWSTSVNLTLPRNELLAFPGLEQSSYKYTYVVGEPITISKFYHFTGVNPQTGLYEFEDYNGDGKITYEEDMRVVRDLAPKFFGGLQNQLSYKGLSLDFLFQFVKQENYNLFATQNYAGGYSNQPAYLAGSWQNPGDVSAYQLFTSGSNDAATAANDLHVYSDAAIGDASYIRLKNVSISYDLPQKMIPGLGLKLFVQGQNLLTITSYKGADPEFIAAGFLPPLKVVTGGLQLTF